MSETSKTLWEEVTLGQLAKGFRGVSYRPENLLGYASNSAVTLLRATNIQQGNLTFDDVQFVPKWLLTPAQFLATGDIAVCMSNGSKTLVGKCAPYQRSEKDAYTVGAFCSIFKPVDVTEAEFVFHLFRSQTYQKNIDVVLAGSAINNLKNSSVESAVFRIPVEKKHRYKIATILTSIDTAIEKTEALIAKYQQIKTGLMHDLFTRGVLPNGQLRPPREQAPELYQETVIGLIPKEWRLMRCADICSRICVGIVIQPTQYYVDAGVPALRSANVREDGINPNNFVFISDKSNQLLSKSQLRAGDIVSVRTGYPGTSSVVPLELHGANCIDILISTPTAVVLPYYLCFWINSSFGKEQVLRQQGGMAQQHFNVGEMRELLVALPTLVEQAAICEKLQLLSQQLDVERARREKMQLQKLGLMQDLLTGKVAVRVDGLVAEIAA